MTYPQHVTVVEVGPRDGLQNEKSVVPTAVKIAFIDQLARSGLPVVEATSFVSPKAIPQLADAAEVLAGITPVAGVRYPVLVPNARGMERALAAGVREIAVFTAASESFTKANINMTIAESFAAFAPLIGLARAEGIRVRGYVSTAFGCPYEGVVPPERVREVALRLFELGVAEVSLGDTIGVGTPNQVQEVVGPLLPDVGSDLLALHMHDTRGTALANVLAGLELGIHIIDSAAGGLGGCPYAPGAAGNLATEDLLYMLHGMGIHTGVDLAAVVAATEYLTTAIRRTPTSKYYQAAMATQG